MLKKFFFISIFCATSIFASQNRAYDVKSAIIEYAIVAESQNNKEYIKGSSKMYFKDFGDLEITDTTMIQKVFDEEEKERNIVKISKDTMFNVDFDEEIIYSSKVASDENGSSRFVLNKENLEKMGASWVGNETILGYKCDIWQLGDDRIWTYNAVPLRQISKSSSGMQMQEAKIANFNIDIKDDKFKLPNFPIKQIDEMFINEEGEGDF
ncbi:hypothetical protein [Arcobacter vandammei]|uniref:hypothetical protein n=1 Tax=Arcobacter vandammei TaxID=2782243 RepID=UPI0018DF5A2F|nr:hypothetical protein [Arcobacter vandammei]